MARKPSLRKMDRGVCIVPCRLARDGFVNAHLRKDSGDRICLKRRDLFGSANHLILCHAERVFLLKDEPYHANGVKRCRTGEKRPRCPRSRPRGIPHGGAFSGGNVREGTDPERPAAPAKEVWAADRESFYSGLKRGGLGRALRCWRRTQIRTRQEV